MSQNLSDQLKLDFLVKQVFGQKQNTEDAYINSAIDRAYRDFNRTIHGYAKAKTETLHATLRDYIKGFITQLKQPLSGQEASDLMHSKVCDSLMKEFETSFKTQKPKLSYGQAQKWVNMTLKYLLTLTLVCESLKDIEVNHQFFHVPIDSYILIELSLNPAKWSRKSKLDYVEYQRQFKAKYPDSIPIVSEFNLWNSHEGNSTFTQPL